MKHKMLTPRSCARFIGVCQHTVLKWLKNGALKGQKLPGSGYYRIETEDVIGFMEGRGMKIPEGLRDRLSACMGDRRFGEITRLLDGLTYHRRQRAYNSMIRYLEGLEKAL